MSPSLCLAGIFFHGSEGIRTAAHVRQIGNDHISGLTPSSCAARTVGLDGVLAPGRKGRTCAVHVRIAGTVKVAAFTRSRAVPTLKHVSVLVQGQEVITYALNVPDTSRDRVAELKKQNPAVVLLQ